MPMRGDRTKRERDRSRNSDLDWFAEDPWSDPELASLEDSQDDWEPDLWGTNDEGLDDSLDLDDGEQMDCIVSVRQAAEAEGAAATAGQ